MSRAFKHDYQEIKVASPLKRLCAWVYDMLLVVSLLMVASGIMVAFNQGEAFDNSPYFALYQSVLFIIVFCFLSYFWTRSGQTLGMLAWRLRVQTIEGKPLNLNQCLVRYLIACLSLSCFGLGFIWMFFNKQKLTWHDMASNSHVVELPKNAKILE